MVMASEQLGGRYELRGVLGRGGMAEVREGWDTRLSRAVAIKLLHPGFSSDADNRRRFEAEAHSAAALSHPNIVAVHDSGEHEGTPRTDGKAQDDGRRSDRPRSDAASGGALDAR
jgi:serine/threonine-protein kinase